MYTVLDIVFLAFFSGVSSFNQFIHELSLDSDVSSQEYLSGEEEGEEEEEEEEEEEDDGDEYEEYPKTTLSRRSRVPRAAFADYGRHQTDWILIPLQFLMGLPFRLFQLVYSGVSKTRSISGCQHPSQPHSPNGVQSLKDQIIHRATDRRRGVIEVEQKFLSLLLYVVFLTVYVCFS
ncbi:hypothetical protein V8G54_004603 [Vigna mungo]|uniref:Uncharacterized protein n=1 Tax=Vigna mungo TaxID=3915 RepID=A0AAQ3SG25_VIGMU